MNATPTSAPSAVRATSMSAPSQNRAALAPSMNPAAIEFEIPSHDRLISPEDEERQRTEAGGERGEGRGHEDRPDVHLHARSIGSAVDGEHGKRT